MTISGGNHAARTVIPSLAALIMALILGRFLKPWIGMAIGVAAGILIYRVLYWMVGGWPKGAAKPREPSSDNGER